MTSTTTIRRELAHRSSNGIQVWLYWDRVGDHLTVEAFDEDADEFFAIEVPRERAMDAFRHPFAYLTSDTQLAA